MTKKIKKSVSILLALVMLCGVLAVAPVAVGAEEELTVHETTNGGALDSNGNPIIGKYTFDPDTGELQLISGRFTGMAWQTNNSWTASINRDDIRSVIAKEYGDVVFTGNCQYMFNNFSYCTDIDLSNVATFDITNMYAMFIRCRVLETIVFSDNFKTDNVEDMRYMFGNCSALETLDLSSFNTNNVVYYENMFNGCDKLNSLTISGDFNLGIRSDMKLNNGKTTDKGWVTSDSETGEIVSGETTSNTAIISGRYLPQQGETKKYVWIASTANYALEPDEDYPGMFNLHLISGFFRGTTWQYRNGSSTVWTADDFSADKVKSVTVESGVKFTGDCKYMFDNFSNCTDIDLSNVATFDITNMYAMFIRCSALKTIVFSDNFKTDNVEDMRSMFGDCSALETLDLSSFNTNNVVYYENMFNGCDKLNSLTISGDFNLGIRSDMKLNNGKTTDKGWIKSDSETGETVSGTGNYAVIAVPAETTTYTWIAGLYEFIEEKGELHLISGFFRGTTWQYRNGSSTVWTADDFSADKVKSVTVESGVKFTGDCKYMFDNFSNCTDIDLSNVATFDITNMYAMFIRCSALKTIVFSDEFKTDKVEDMRYMFGDCSVLETLDLSSFNTNNVDYCENMFTGCNKLSSLTISEKFELGIRSDMNLNNGENGNGWRIVGDPEAQKVSGDDNNAVIAAPSSETTYIWIGYYNVDWKNWDGTKLVKTEEYKAETNIHPTYKGVTPTRPDSDGKTYTFAGWIDNLGVEYGVNDELPVVTRDTTYTAKFTEVPKKFFAAHSLTLDGDIGVNFFIDVTAAGITPQDILSGDSTLTLDFSWDTDPVPITDVSKDSITLSKSNASRYYNEDNGYFKIKCNVAAAEMACKIKADGIVAGAKDYTESETYSVRDYGMSVINNPSKYSETLVDLAKKMLDYGAKAQKVFNIIPDDLANKDVTGYTMTNVTASDIQAAIEAEPANKEKTASDMASGTSDFGLRYASSTVVYLTKSTLRHYYYIDDQGKYDNVKAKFNERKLPAAVYIEYSDIAAADLDKLQTFAIDSTHTYYYSALNYAKDVIGSNSSKDENKKLAMAMYWYNQAANAYFK